MEDKIEVNNSGPAEIIMEVPTGKVDMDNNKSNTVRNQSISEPDITPSISEFYSGKTVFLTGATGFIGKVIIEKLLRSCPGLKAIYCLVRPKKGVSGRERLHDLFNAAVFDRLSDEQPHFSEKVFTIDGDITFPDLGISEDNRTNLCNEVDIVIHSAATVRFDEPLRVAVEMNLLAVRKMIKLCRQFEKLKVFVHVSTAYSNCDLSHIEEKVYPPPVDPKKLIEALEWMDDDTLNSMTRDLIKDKPNTYTYTKQLAESLLLNEGSDLPLAIVRPSIVTASWKEPLPGWIDNYNGPSGLYIAAGKGIMRTMRANPGDVADFIPVDLTSNTLITVAWYTAVMKPNRCLVYHCTSGSQNPIYWGDMVKIVNNHFEKLPLDSCFRRPACQMHENNPVHKYFIFVSHLIPAYIADIASWMVGKEPRMVRIYQRLHKSMENLEWFTTRSWTWTHDNSNLLLKHMSEEDRKTFYLDLDKLNWHSYIENFCNGTKMFVLKEDASGIPAAKAHLKRLRNVRYVFNGIIMVMLWRFLIARSNLAKNTWSLFMGLVYKFVQFFRITSTITKS